MVLFFKWQIWFSNVGWLSEKESKTSVEDQRDEHSDQLHVRQLVLIQMFYALLEHFCTRRNLRKKLLTGMFVQTSPQYSKLLTRLSFTVHLNYKVQFSVILMFTLVLFQKQIIAQFVLISYSRYKKEFKCFHKHTVAHKFGRKKKQFN